MSELQSLRQVEARRQIEDRTTRWLESAFQHHARMMRARIDEVSCPVELIERSYWDATSFLESWRSREPLALLVDWPSWESLGLVGEGSE